MSVWLCWLGGFPTWKTAVQVLPEEHAPADNTSVAALIFMIRELTSEGTVEKSSVSNTEGLNTVKTWLWSEGLTLRFLSPELHGTASVWGASSAPPGRSSRAMLSLSFVLLRGGRGHKNTNYAGRKKSGHHTIPYVQLLFYTQQSQIFICLHISLRHNI